ncbi:hypothetical protein [Streptomyces sp. NPDC056660]|uniref:hypothetical protein n=1 Tax=Streptomyces sp. NPDC056660 TaxID=3345897 RepID=UPI00367BE00D
MNSDFGCGKAMPYREVPTKDDLVVAYLERYTRTFDRARELVAEQRPDDPAGQLVAIISWTAEQAMSPGYRGRPAHNAHAEFPPRNTPPTPTPSPTTTRCTAGWSTWPSRRAPPTHADWPTD